ncbi:UDP-glycosyltransferase 83A1-like [Humulus lupulus]|uniref:UDP-glycosyltransferase 83A1-like n=1 Tax=Humulus lupulus TaxID=3486 RepID=UPI002B407634|nr:UDP-glycosyltransferase 83A1-like [Humulus lupulus]
MSTRSKQRVMVVPATAQGHVKPLMLFAHKLAQHGFRITFVHTEFSMERILSAMSDDNLKTGTGSENIELVSIPDGLSPEDDRTVVRNICRATLETMSTELEKLIRTINGNITSDIIGEPSESTSNDKISCLICDVFLGFGMEVAAKMGIQGALFCPSSAAILAYTMNIPKIIHDGIVDDIDGKPTQKQIIQLSFDMPGMDTSTLPWKFDDLPTQKMLFQLYLKIGQALKTTQWCLCNTTQDIESVAISLFPKVLPIGPLTVNKTSSHLDISGSQFWIEDASCLNWLDQHKPRSVIYVAFGSFTIHDKCQFNELAHGLELTGRPFLWVVRPGFISSNEQENKFDPYKFLGNNNNVRMIVNWAPQQKVLNHPSIACFVTHCGWNSTIEGLSNGVPFLCWPYFADQFLNKDYICDIWKIGMEVVPNENGIITREEVKNQVKRLLDDVDIRKRALEFKKIAIENIAKDGRSSKNLNNFIKWLELL